MNPSEFAARRKAIVKASRGRHVLRSVQPPQPPDALALTFAARFKRIMRRRLNDFVRELFRLHRVRTDTLHPMAKTFDELVAYFGELFVNDFSLQVGEMVSGVSKFNAGQLNEVFVRLLRIPFADKPGLEKKLEVARTQNIAKIKSQSVAAMQRIREVMDANVGESALTLTKLLEPVVTGGASKAALLARDQTLKLNGQLTQERHTEAGITRYEWVTSNDDRVRPWHARLNDRDFEWTEPPAVSKDGRHEHPGGDYQCRCIANPIIDLDSLK